MWHLDSIRRGEGKKKEKVGRAQDFLACPSGAVWLVTVAAARGGGSFVRTKQTSTCCR